MVRTAAQRGSKSKIFVFCRFSDKAIAGWAFQEIPRLSLEKWTKTGLWSWPAASSDANFTGWLVECLQSKKKYVGFWTCRCHSGIRWSGFETQIFFGNKPHLSLCFFDTNNCPVLQATYVVLDKKDLRPFSVAAVPFCWDSDCTDAWHVQGRRELIGVLVTLQSSRKPLSNKIH